MHPDDISRLFPTVLKAAKLPKIRFHDLRHSCATLEPSQYSSQRPIPITETRAAILRVLRLPGTGQYLF